MPNPASTSRPRPAPKSGKAARGLSVDELAAERNTPPLPPEPVFTIDLVEVEAESGKRGRKYVADLEERAHRNALAAAEARALALEQRRHLEDAADGRRAAERQIAALNRELKTAVAEQQRLELRNRTRAAEPVPPAPVLPDPAAATSEVATLREAVEQQQRLLGEGRERLASALRERDAARLDARQASEARDRAKRSLNRATDLLHEHALTESDGETRACGRVIGSPDHRGPPGRPARRRGATAPPDRRARPPDRARRAARGPRRGRDRAGRRRRGPPRRPHRDRR